MMLKRKMRSNPYFKAYLEALNKMEDKGLLGKHFEDWVTVNKTLLAELKSSKNRDYGNFLEFSVELFDKQAMRYSKTGLTWFISTLDYKFKVDKDVPFVKLEENDLIGVRKEDSIVIKNTSGLYYPLTFTWKGEKGKVDWVRAGLPESVYCTFNTYQIDIKTNNYQVDTVNFNHPTFFDQQIQGRFEDKVIVITNNNVSYPRFQSFEKDLKIRDIGDNISYKGGFSLEGSSVIGFGDKLNLAEMNFLKKIGELAINTKAEIYVIRRGERIIAQNAKASLYFEKDSIYHPSIDFRFDIKERQLTLTREGIGNSQIAFFNSYHELEMEVERIAWQIDVDSIEVGQSTMQSISNRPKKGEFESLAYYNDRDYRRIQNIADYNPVSTIKAYSEAIDSRELDANLLAKKFNPNLKLVSVKGLLNNLVEGGFIFYDEEREMVIVKNKTFHYAEASRKKRDFDVIRAVSESKRNNGVLDLNSKELILNGVKSVTLSDSQLVAIKPAGGQLIFKKNRDMDFNGQVFAGFGIFWGNNFNFDYNRFLMNLDSVDQFMVRIPTGERDRLNMPVLASLTTLIEDMTAIIEIDTVDIINNVVSNRSSRIPLHRFPRLTSLNKSRVYYSDKKTAGGKYSRDGFYFELDPFVIDSLDGFDPAGVKFDGQLVSAEIFPEFREVLVVQEKDLSLGFTTETPPEGLPMYGGKGTYNNTIQLGNKGLKGKGTMKYLTSTINSDDILFLPNSTLATADSFNVEMQSEPVEFPTVRGKDVKVDWRPYVDSMYVRSATDPFDIFNSEYQLDGALIMTPGGLYGDGTFDWKDGTLISKSMRFNTFGIDADTSNLNIKTKDQEEALAFSTKNVNSSIDFDKKIGKFKSNSNAVNTEMPYTQYKTSMNEFDWDMDRKEISFRSTNNDAVFVSTKREQFGLKFSGEKANYNLETNLLKIEGVPEIKVADALVVPSDGEIVIEANAEMKPLENATIIADTLNRYHVIKDAQVFIQGKKSYQANNGTYAYDVVGKPQEIKFKSIIVARGKNKNLVTKANGSLLQVDNFIIDKNIGFKGKAELDAGFEGLEFNGYAKINVPKLTTAQWFSIDTRIEKNNVIIAYNKPRNEDGKRLEVGLRIEYDSTEIYPLVLTAPKSQRDLQVFNAVGIMKADNIEGTFYFGDSSKILNNSKRGNVVRFRNNDGKITTEGIYTLGKKMKGLQVKASGQSTSKFGEYNTLMDLMIGVNFQIPDKLMNVMIKDIEANSSDVEDAKYNKEHFKNALAEFVTDEKKYAKIEKDLVEYERVFLPKDLVSKYKLIFGHVPMVWNSEVQSFLSKGSALDITYLGNTAVNKRIKSHLEFRMTRQADEMNFYIESSGGNYYYFNYRITEGKAVVSIFSNNTNFMNTYTGLKKKELQFKAKDIDTVVLPTGPGAVTYFLKRANLAN
jgi:hypothetical protein